MGQTTKAYQESFEDSKRFFEAFCVCRFRSQNFQSLAFLFLPAKDLTVYPEAFGLRLQAHQKSQIVSNSNDLARPLNDACILPDFPFKKVTCKILGEFFNLQ